MDALQERLLQQGANPGTPRHSPGDELEIGDAGRRTEAGGGQRHGSPDVVQVAPRTLLPPGNSVAAVVSPRAPHASERFGKQEILEGVEAPDVPLHLQSDFQTVLNTVNLYVGAGLLSMPFAMKIGGWLGLGVLALCAAMSCTTAHLISFSCDLLPPGVAPSYPALGKAAFGPSGEWLLLGAVMLEFWGALSMCLIIVWRSLAIAFSAKDVCILHQCMPAGVAAVLLTLLVAVPVVLIRSFSRLTSVAMSGVISSTVLSTVMVAAWALDPSGALVPDPSAHQHVSVDWAHLPVAAGIFIVSLSGHAGLPSLRRGMQQPSHFPHCLKATFLCIFLLYGTMAFFGYVYFGEAAEVLVTGNLNSGGSLAGVVLVKSSLLTVTLSQALSLLVACSVFTTVPPLVYVLGEIITDFALGMGHRDRATGGRCCRMSREGLETLFRLLVLSVGYLMALSCYNVLAQLESMVGGVLSMTASLILPTLMFHSLSSGKLTCWDFTMLRMFLAVVITAPILIVYSNLGL